MSTGQDGGGGGKGRRTETFLSAHRCPEVDILPNHNSDTQILVTGKKKPKFTSNGTSETNYLDVSSTNRSEEEEEEEGSISDWSEEDLYLHFSPSVIHPSDDEESEPESSFECVDITMETLEKGQEGEGLKMVPKRQIQLKKKEVENIFNDKKTEEVQVTMKDELAKGHISNSEVSANELLCHNVGHRPDLLIRQHSMPASLHGPSVTSIDSDSYRVYKGMIAGAGQGFQVGGTSRQRLQKSFSLDETKTKMASCIIKNVLSKKMQEEQNHSKTSYVQKKPAVLPGLMKSVDQKVREGEGGKTGGMFKAPAHVVRDVRSLVKNSYSVSFPTAPTTTPENSKSKSITMIGQDKSPPPTYQQAVAVKSQDEISKSTKAVAYSSSSGGKINRIPLSLSQSQQNNNRSNRFSRPVVQQRRGKEPITNKSRVENTACSDILSDLPENLPVCSDLSEINQSERVDSEHHQIEISLPHAICVQAPPPLHPPSKPGPCKETQPLLSAQDQSSVKGVTSQLASNSPQQIIHSCFFTPTALPAFPTSIRPHVGKVSYMHTPLSYIQTRLQHVPNVPTLHLLRRSEENQTSLTGNTSNQKDSFNQTCPPNQTRTSGAKESIGNKDTPPTQEQTEHQKHQQQQFQGLLPAQVGGDLLVNITGGNAAPGILLRDAASCHVMLDPTNGRCFYVDKPPQPQRKMLLDPETGQYVQVFLPVSNSTPNNSVLPVSFANPAHFAPPVINPTPAVLSVMQLQPAVAVSSLYGTPCLPFTLQTPSVNFTAL
ncbi:uncharacterized protein [Antennarius striatus]|uniref:uncharacterized protein n=1 Tax=Antennarius striatus TaxID=241820 RepID=UPI0035B1A8F7